MNSGDKSGLRAGSHCSSTGVPMKRYRAIAEYYDAEYDAARVPRARRAVFPRPASERSRQSVLELAAGTARAAIPIAQAGHRVVGVDYAEDMLAIARRQARRGRADGERELRARPRRRAELEPRDRSSTGSASSSTRSSPSPRSRSRTTAPTVRATSSRAAGSGSTSSSPTSGCSRGAYRPVSTRSSTCRRFDRTVFTTTEIRRDREPQVQRVTFNYRWFDSTAIERRPRRSSST